MGLQRLLSVTGVRCSSYRSMEAKVTTVRSWFPYLKGWADVEREVEVAGG